MKERRKFLLSHANCIGINSLWNLLSNRADTEYGRRDKHPLIGWLNVNTALMDECEQLKGLESALRAKTEALTLEGSGKTALMTLIDDLQDIVQMSNHPP